MTSPAPAANPASAAAASFDPAGFRLLIVADSSSTHTHRWAGYFRDRGASVSIISNAPDPIEGVQVHLFPPRRRFYHRIPKVRMLIDCIPFRRLVRAINPQLIHFHFVSEGGRAFFWDAIRTPMVASSWGQDVIFDTGPRPAAEKSLRRMFARCRIITATTHQLAAATARFTPDARPVYVIPFGVDLSRFTPAQAADRPEIRLGFVKHLLPKYGPDVLVEAFDIIHRQRPNTRLVLAGRGDMRPALEKRIAELGLADAVEIMGRVAHEQVPQLVRSLDLFVMPSVYESETFGVAAIEASACAVPVVASRVGGVPEAVLHGQTGLLVPPRDVHELARACIELIDNPARRAAMGRAGRAFVERYYVWQDNARMMEEVYRAALVGEEPRNVPVYRPGATPQFPMDPAP